MLSSFALGSRRKPSFQWNMGFKVVCKLYENNVFGVSNGISHLAIGYIYIQSYSPENMKNVLLKMSYTVFKLHILILDSMMERTVSQIFYLGPRFYFMKCRK